MRVRMALLVLAMFFSCDRSQPIVKTSEVSALPWGRSFHACDINNDGRPEVYIGIFQHNLFCGTPGIVVGTTLGDPAYNFIKKAESDLDYGFGSSLTDVADCDGDGMRDIVIGCPLSSRVARFGGAIFVVSSASGSVLHSQISDIQERRFGSSVLRVDSDASRQPELIAIGSPGVFGKHDLSGLLQITRLAGETTTQTFSKGVPGDALGYRVVATDNFGESHRRDLLVTSRESRGDVIVKGRVFLVSSRDASQLFEYAIQSNGNVFNHKVIGLARRNAYASPDVAVAYSEERNNQGLCGVICVISGVDGKERYRFVSDAAGTMYDATIVAVHAYDSAHRVLGIVHCECLESKETPRRLLVTRRRLDLKSYDWTIELPMTPFCWGAQALEIGDVDNDGVGDILVAAREVLTRSTDHMWVVSGRDGSILRKEFPPLPEGSK